MRWLKGLGVALAAIAAVLGVAFIAYRFWPRTSPPGQPNLLTLPSLTPIQAAFNEQSGEERVLVLLSPTCPKCVAGAAGLGELFANVAATRTPTLVVWMPVIASDIAPPTSGKLALLPGPHVRQFWDPKHLVSQQILAMGRANLERLSQDERDLVEHADVAWDLVALFPRGARWDEGLPWPSLWGFPVEDTLERLSSKLADRH